MPPKGHDPEVFPIVAVNAELAKGLDVLAEQVWAAGDAEWGGLGEVEDPKVIPFPKRELGEN